MSHMRDIANWMYGDVLKDRGFWYSHSLFHIHDLSEEQLYWIPEEKSLCMLWHAGHIAHREKTHIASIIQGVGGEIIPPMYELFGDNWCTPDEIRDSVDSVEKVFKWIEKVRNESTEFINSLDEDDFHKIPDGAFGLSVGHWLFITASHCALHIGKIQLLRNMLLGNKDNPC